jgi:hypothetical protein
MKKTYCYAIAAVVLVLAVIWLMNVNPVLVYWKVLQLWSQL